MVLTNTAFRLSPELIARLDVYAEQLQKQDALGRQVTRSDAARVLLTRALDAAGVPPGPERRTKPRGGVRQR